MGPNARIGITIGTLFGLGYVIVNAGALPAQVALVVQLAAGAVFVGTQVALWGSAERRPAAPDTRGGFGRGYWAVVAVEVVALVGGRIVVVRALDVPEAGVAWVTLVVGLHFFGLAVLWRESSLHVLGTALTLCGAVALLLAATDGRPAPVAVVGGVLPGALLLAGGAWAAVEGRRTVAGQPV